MVAVTVAATWVGADADITTVGHAGAIVVCANVL